jgi:hypothetical protein
MKHQPFDQIRARAHVTPAQTLSRKARLRRWAELLLETPDHKLRALYGVEFHAPRERAQMRADNSPLAAAYADPVLRGEGLEGDTLGEIQTFFGLSFEEAHYLVCDCHFRGGMDGRGVGRRVRAVADANPLQRLWIRLCA